MLHMIARVSDEIIPTSYMLQKSSGCLQRAALIFEQYAQVNIHTLNSINVALFDAQISQDVMMQEYIQILRKQRLDYWIYEYI